ncbi:transient receptor potential cation channel subfamily M member 2-like [Mytilus trossulus]|uniref:transient receptor potential cation channel subfamily M member 2-like n=1 Tax=Mytilus trossulus TaxID=6551 RepID=UPI003003EF39
MATIANSNFLKYSRYFPNHLEYASHVPRDWPEIRRLKKPKILIVDSKPNYVLCVENLEHIDIPPKSKSKEPTDRKRKKHPIATTSASQTDGCDAIQTYTQTDDKIIHEIATQTEDEEVPDSPKRVVEEPQHVPTFERVEYAQQSSGVAQDKQPSQIPTPEKNWEDLRNFGEPRIVVSVIGAYNECTQTYEWADHMLLKNAIAHVARYSGRCGFLYNEKNTDFVNSVVSRSCVIKGLPLKYGYTSMHFSDRLKEHKTTDKQHTCYISEHCEDLLELEKYINSKGRVLFEEGEKKSKTLSSKPGGKGHTENQERADIRVPVALLVLNGDLDTLDHVMRAIYSDISVVVVKGTGGAADLIALCLENFSKLKKELPIMITRRFTKGHFNKILEVFKMIIEKDWMISIFDIKVEEHDCLWERITDGITRAWSYEETQDEEVMMDEYLPLNGGEYISKYVANIDGLTRRELFAGYCLTEPNQQKDSIDTIDNNREDVFATSFHGGKIEMMEQILNSDENFSMSKSTFQGLWKQEIAAEDDKILQSVCPSDIEDPNAPLYIADELLKGLCCSKIGMITCCKRCRNNDKEDNSDNISDTVPTNETLLVAVLLNKTQKAAALWHQFDNPMMTALISSMFLTSLANIAEEKFEENRQNQYQSHAKLFLSRAVLLLEKMFTDDEQMAIEALDHVCDVWGNIESPLHFGHQFNIEEFISHSSNQKDASKRLFAYNVVSVEDIKLDIKDEPETENAPPREQNVTPTTSIYSITISGWFSFIKNHWRKKSKLSIVTAPVTMIVIHILFFITALMMFSYFLTRDLQPGSINLLEGLIFIYMLGDLLEEIWSMIRPQKDCHWSPQRIFLHIFNIWNILDLLCFILYILGFCMHILDSDLIAHTRRIYSIALFIMFLRLLNFLLLSKRFGIIIIMVKEMLVDLMQYLVILIILILAAGVVYHANVYPSHTIAGPSNTENWRTWSILQIPYWQVYGELFMDTLEGNDNSDCKDNANCATGDWITPVIAAIYMMLTNWLLLNIVIAMFSARFKEIRKKSEQKWRYYRHSVIIDFEDRIPSPLNFPFRIFSFLWYTKKCPCCPCYKKTTTGDRSDMLKKERQFAKVIIVEENHENRISKKQHTTNKL